VLSALDVLGSDLQAALRVTLGRSTTPADVEFIVAQVVTVVQLLRQV
jgi:cysteine sulfinate desulfinase/cysteine desulfurase-like protein